MQNFKSQLAPSKFEKPPEFRHKTRSNVSAEGFNIKFHFHEARSPGTRSEQKSLNSQRFGTSYELIIRTFQTENLLGRNSNTLNEGSPTTEFSLVSLETRECIALVAILLRKSANARNTCVYTRAQYGAEHMRHNTEKV
jgi:hypothetical protein